MPKKKAISTFLYSNSIVVDTNILLLLLIGYFDKNVITKWNRTDKYTQEDFKFLKDYIAGKLLITTPNILTEVSNLAFKLPERRALQFASYLKDTIPTFNEHYFECTQLVIEQGFLKFGITDASIIELSKKGIPIITDDFPLWAYLANQGFNAINFSHLRSNYILNK